MKQAKTIQEVLASVAGLSADEQAKKISEFYADKRRKQTVEDARREVRSKVFGGLKKLTKAQQESLLYEFVGANASYINNWMHKNHKELEVVNGGNQ